MVDRKKDVDSQAPQNLCALREKGGGERERKREIERDERERETEFSCRL